MDDPKCKELVQPSTGTHIVFPNYYSPRQMGLIDPSSSDGRVIFFIPWEGNTLAGTTDAPATVIYEPRASRKDIDFIVDEVGRYLDPKIQVRKCDVLAAWSGLRPLVKDPTKTSTQELVRNHIIILSSSGLMTIAGGKWTTYRKMAKETIDAAIKEFALQPARPVCRTEKIPLIGSHGYYSSAYIKLIQQFGLETEVAQHLVQNYGDRAPIVAAIAEGTNRRWPLYGNRLVPHYPFLEAEVRYAVRFEYAVSAIDVLARRTRLAHLSCQAALDALERVVDIMAEELGWESSEKDRQIKSVHTFLETCGLNELHPVRAEFARKHLVSYKDTYRLLTGNQEAWPRISYADAVNGWKILAKEEQLTEPADWKTILTTVDSTGIGSIGFGEFLDGIAMIKSLRSSQKDCNNLQSTGSKPPTERGNWSV